MSLEFKYYKIEDIGEVVSGGTPSTSKNEYWNGDIGWITPKDLSSYDDIYISRGERNISAEGLNNSSAKLVPKNTILMTSRAPIGYIAIANNELSTNQGFKSLICNEDICHFKYFYYWLKLNIKYIINNANGSTFKEISGGTFKNLEISLPPLNEQKAISSVLWTIDEKISVLKKIKKNLNKIIRTLYNSWFVNFLPFQNEEFNDTYMGRIPNGWEIKNLNEVCDTISETFDKNTKNIVLINTSDVYKGKVLNHEFVPNENIKGQFKKLFRKNDILYSEIRPANKHYAFVNFNSNNYIASTKLMVLRAKSNIIHPYILYLFLTSKDMIMEFSLLAESRSGTFPQITFNEIKHEKIIVPPLEVYEDFWNNIESLVEKQYIIDDEIIKLTQLRDILLPKLMSGEIDVSKINYDF